VLAIVVHLNFNELLAASLLVHSVAERINALAACINIWLDHPLGIGLGLYGYFFNLYDQAGFFADKLDFYPNNDPAMFLAYGGIPYLLAYLWVFHYSIISTPSRWVRVALLVLLVQSISSYLFFNPAAAITIAFALSGRALARPERLRPRRMRKEALDVENAGAVTIPQG
jgi:hypothetical protein